jgi:1,4-dihydroxy-6-naphthoate synthase
MKLTLGFSPCPNDTFIFDALINGKIDTEGLSFELFLEDVQTLNQWALQQKLDITKISYGVLPLITNNYKLLDAGGALGKGVGPLLISKKKLEILDIPNCKIAIPGRNTTAHILFSLAFPTAHKKEFMTFSSIEDAVFSGNVDCGVIIHENRFTYLKKGLLRIMDLGEYWEGKTNCPIPLGGIVVKKFTEIEIQQKLNSLIRQSVEFAFSNYPQLPDFVKKNAQEMEEEVMRKHIELYVNDYTIALGEDGKKAVQKFTDIYESIGKSMD